MTKAGGPLRVMVVDDHPVFAEALAMAIEAKDECTHELDKEWPVLVEEPARTNGLPPPKLCTVQSPYRLVITPIMDHILEVARQNPGRRIAVLIPETVKRHWYDYLLQNNRASALTALLLLKGQDRIVVINVPLCLDL